MGAPGIAYKEFYQAVTSLSQHDLGEFYIGGTLRSGRLRIFTEMHVSGVTSAWVESLIGFSRVNAVSIEPTSIQVVRLGGSPHNTINHTATMNGNNVLVRTVFTATAPGSELIHHVEAKGSKLISRYL